MRNNYIEGLKYSLPHPFRAESERAIKEFANTVKIEGVLRWKQNGRVPPQELLEFWKHMGFKFNMAKTKAASARETRESLKVYRDRSLSLKHSDEDLFEMRAAFGEGATVVDVITGKKTKL